MLLCGAALLGVLPVPAELPETSNLMRVGMMSMLFWGNFWMGLFVVSGEDMHAALWGRAAGGGEEKLVRRLFFSIYHPRTPAWGAEC